MPLPQKVIEQLSREPPRTPGWSGRLLMFSSTIFLFSLFIYLGIIFGYRPYLDSEVKKLNNQIQSFAQQIPLEEQEKIIAFYSQLVNLRSLLAGHTAVSPFFEWLERNTHQNVFFSKLTLNIQGQQAVFVGTAKTVVDMAEQLQVFQERPEVRRATFSSVTIGSAGTWQFNATLILDPRFFREAAVSTT